MQALDLPSRRRVLKTFRPRPMDPFLYKYFSSNHKYSYQNLRDVIVGSVLRLNSPCHFNDPFEMWAHFIMTSTEAEKRGRFESLAREQAPHLGWRAIQARINNLMSFDEKDFTPIWQQSLKSVREIAGVYCFAGSAKNTLMWSHYASNHNGVCIQFERVRDIATFSHAVRVRYVPDLPILNWVVGFHEGISEMIFAKHPCWEYERESRMMLYGQAGRYVPFDPQALRKVIFGCRADAKLVDAVDGWLAEREAAGYAKPDVYFTNQHAKQYRLVITPRISP